MPGIHENLFPFHLLRYLTSFITIKEVINLCSSNKKLLYVLQFIPLDLRHHVMDIAQVMTLSPRLYITHLDVRSNVSDVLLLPKRILSTLQHLDINRYMVDSKIHRFHDKIIELNLDVDILKYCSNLTTLNISSIIYAVNIDMLCECKKLTSLNCATIPSVSWAAHLPMLKKLELSGYINSFADFTSVKEFPSLSWLRINHSNILSVLPCYNLTHLELYGCYSITSLQGIQAYSKLERLQLSECKNLIDIKSIHECSTLREIEIFSCLNIRDLYLPPYVTDLFVGTSNISNIDDISECANLRRLRLLRCDDLYDFDAILNLKKLEFVLLSHCKMKDIYFLSRCSKLRHLVLDNCYLLDNIYSIKFLTSLNVLTIVLCGCDLLINYISCLTGLISLTIDGYSFTDLDLVSAMTNLHTLKIFNNRELYSLNGIQNCSKLKTLHVEGCYGLTDTSAKMKSTSMNTENKCHNPVMKTLT